MIIYIR